MIECTACHTTSPSTINGGPHGMHPISQDWVTGHHDLISKPPTQCKACHGADYRGTVLSRAQAERKWNVFGGSISFARGAQIGCYNCHPGVTEGDANPSVAPTVANVSTNTTNDRSVAMVLPVTGAVATPRIVTQPANGSVGLDSATRIATYFPNSGFVGVDTFTFAAYDGSKSSGLGTGTVTVVQGPFSLAVGAFVPPSYPAGWPVAMSAVPSVTNSSQPVSFDWDFGDGAPHSALQYAAHTYTSPGTYTYSVTLTVSGVSASFTGGIVIGEPVLLSASYADPFVTLSWPVTLADTLLEQTSRLGSLGRWQVVTNPPVIAQGPPTGLQSVTLPAAGNGFFRVSRPW
jgi:hypothetical protein